MNEDFNNPNPSKNSLSSSSNISPTKPTITKNRLGLEIQSNINSQHNEDISNPSTGGLPSTYPMNSNNAQSQCSVNTIANSLNYDQVSVNTNSSNNHDNRKKATTVYIDNDGDLETIQGPQGPLQGSSLDPPSYLESKQHNNNENTRDTYQTNMQSKNSAASIPQAHHENQKPISYNMPKSSTPQLNKSSEIGLKLMSGEGMNYDGQNWAGFLGHGVHLEMANREYRSHCHCLTQSYPLSMN